MPPGRCRGPGRPPRRGCRPSAGGRAWHTDRRRCLERSEARTPSCGCSLPRSGSSQRPLLLQFRDEAENPVGNLALHGHLIFEIPLHDKPAIAIDVDMSRRVITLPGDEDEPAASKLAHQLMLPWVVTCG